MKQEIHNFKEMQDLRQEIRALKAEVERKDVLLLSAEAASEIAKACLSDRIDELCQEIEVLINE
tara:strand:+ start:574 stop:765 length:192 start_codon:yes stop_codon:yes gene_type:complete